MHESTSGAAWNLGSSERDVGRMRAISSTIGELIEDVVDTTRLNVASAGVETPRRFRLHDNALVGFSGAAQAHVEMICRAMLEEVYTNPIRRPDDLQGRADAQRYLRRLPRGSPTFCPGSSGRTPTTMGSSVAVCDYLAGMTDRYAHGTSTPCSISRTFARQTGSKLRRIGTLVIPVSPEPIGAPVGALGVEVMVSPDAGRAQRFDLDGALGLCAAVCDEGI